MGKTNNSADPDGSVKTLELATPPREISLPIPDKKSKEKKQNNEAKKHKKEKKEKKNKDKKLKNKAYNKELSRLQVELVKLQEWIKHKGLKVVFLFEGRDAVGKGGVIKRIIQRMNPRICRVVALGTQGEGEGESPFQ
jgi:polyphosphate kinase 2 (PPK2 family)